MEYGEKHRKTCKMRNTHCKNWKMERNTEKRGKFEMHTVELEYGKKTENRGK